tara:strand:- start:81 stop:332 length:252 start_codon:yes stop_codon:yes gene_type:complete
MTEKYIVTDDELNNMIIKIEYWLKKMKAKIKKWETQNEQEKDTQPQDEYKHKYKHDKQDNVRAGCIVTHNQSIINWQKSLRNY